MLKRAIRNIRRKPKAVRDQYALWVAVIFTAIIIIIWFATVSSRFASVTDTSPEDAAVPVQEPESFTDMIGGLREEIQNISQASSSQTDITQAAATTTWTPTGSTPRPVADPTSAQAIRIATFTKPVATTTP